MLLRCLFILFACSIQAKPQLFWLQADWPPHQIVNGPYQGQGTFDLLQQQLQAVMPQFEHKFRLVSLARLEQAFLQQEAGNCALGALYSELRAGSRLYSKPLALHPALAIGFVSGKLSRHSAIQSEGVNLNVLALDSTLTGAYQPNRLYPPAITQMLQRAGSNLNRYALTSELNAVALLASGRIDYVVEYPERLQYYNSVLPQAVSLEHRAIIGANTASVSYVACTKDAIGQAAIAAVNQALYGLWQQAEYLQAMQRWLDERTRRRLNTDLQRLQQSALVQFESEADKTANTR
jgi:uncharacterized protein (TIGR02285 family)